MISDNDIKIIKKVLNSKVATEKFPNVLKFNVYKGKKGVSIGAKYCDNKYIVTKVESENLKITISELLQLSSIEINPKFLFFYRIFERTGDVNIY